MRAIRVLYIDGQNRHGDPAKQPVPLRLYKASNGCDYTWFAPDYKEDGEPDCNSDADLYGVDTEVSGTTVLEAIRRAYVAWGMAPWNLRKTRKATT